jgi:hypothetical protein
MSAFGRPMTGRRPRMTRAHDRQKTRLELGACIM